MKNVKRKNTLIKGLLVLVAFVLMNTLAFAQNGNGNKKNKTEEETTTEKAPAIEAAAFAAPPGGGGGGGTLPSNPTGYIYIQSTNTCGNKTLARSSNPPAGTVWYWQTSASGTSVSYSGTTYTATSTRTYYIRAYKPSSGTWSSGYISKYITITPYPSTPATPSVSNGCTGSTLTRGTAPGGVTWYWQTTSNGTATGSANAASDYYTTGSGTMYLRARNSSGCWSSAASRTYSELPKPATPGDITETNNCGSTVLTRPTPPSSQTYYWQTSPGGTSTGNSAPTITKTSGSGTYYLKARINSTGCWSLSYSQEYYTVKAIPSAPSGLSQGSQTTSSFVASWNTVSGADSYRLDVSTNNSFTAMVSGYNNLSVTGTSLTVSGLNAGQYYYFRVRTVDNGCTSGNSGTFTANTILAIPTTMDATGNYTSSFQANWGSVAGATYRLDVSTNDTFTAILSNYNNKSVTGTSQSVTGLSPGTNYYYRVRAYSSAYTSGNSTTKTATTTLNVPVAQQPACPTSDSFTASWGTISGASEYLLYVSTESDFSSHVTGYNGLSVSSTSQPVNSLTPDTYYYRLKSQNSAYTSSYSNTITVTVMGNHNVTGGIHCSNAGTLIVGLDGSESGVMYQLYFNYAPVLVNGGPAIVSVGGTGGAVNFTYDATAVGVYEVYAVSGSCSTQMTGEARIIDPPNAYAITTAAYCANTNGALTMADTDLDAEYQVKKDGSNLGSSITGTGSGMTLGNYNDPGTYTVEATYPGSNCSAVPMTGSITVDPIVPDPNPTIVVSDEECGDRTITFTGSAPDAGTIGFVVNWKWMDTDPDPATSAHSSLSATETVSLPDTYYIRAQGLMTSGNTCWSNPVAIEVLDLIPGGYPTNIDISNISVPTSCGPQSATITAPPAGESYFWQGISSTSKVETDGGTISDLITDNGIYYIRAKTDEGCWGPAVSFAVDNITKYPLVKTLTGPSTSNFADDPAHYRRIYVENSEGDVIYHVQQNSTNIGNDFRGSDQTARSGMIRQDGDYTVLAERNGCTTEMGQTVTISSDTNENSSTSRSYTIPEDIEANLPTTTGDVLISTTYADGMGRAMQTVAKQVSPDQKDMVNFYEFDDLGRMSKQYMPYTDALGTDGLFKADPKADQATFYQNSGDNIANDTRPFSETSYEASPMSRVKSQQGVGEEWLTNNRKGSVQYETNVLADDIYIWELVNDIPSKTGVYAAGELFKNIGQDEENRQVITYSNRLGQSIVRKMQGPDSSWVETYHVYDTRGRVRYVLSPGAIEAFNTNGNVMDQALLDTWAFQYKYDHRSRLIEKRVPGADWVYMVYDDRDRLVMSQDGNQRNEDPSNKRWSFVKYDEINRPIISGEVVINDAVGDIRTDVANASVFFETYDSNGLVKYTNLAYPVGITVDDIYTVTYYDNYNFTSKTFNRPSGIFTATGNLELPAQTGHALKGLTTGSLTKVLDAASTTFLESVNFYDDKYRVVQSISENHKGGGDTTTVQYNFAGQVMKTHVKHNPKGLLGDTTIIEQEYTYDHMGRSLTTTHSVDGATAVTIASFTYNELGQLENKTLADGFEDIDYKYNIRGWITQMNDPDDAEQHLFEMEFRHEDALTAANKRFDGNITEVDWKNPYESAVNTFDYTYDELSRLKTADYSSTAGGTRDYGLESINYDINSNITALKRKGDHDDTANQSFDDLTYTYSGNKLLAVTDNAAMDTGFKDGNTSGDDYVYDDNGNLTEDKNKGITAITYNHINQPDKLIMGSDSIEYTYSASGAKLSQTEYKSGVGVTTDYLGGFIYKDDKLQLIGHSQGRVVAEYDASETFTGYEYQYHLTDHLGNIRVTFKTEFDQDIYDEATFEDADTTGMQTYFEKYEEITRIKSDLLNHTGSGEYSLWLDGTADRKIGLAKSLMVKPGDVIDMEVWAKYYDYGSQASWTALLSTLAGQISSGASGVVYDGASGASGLPFADFLNGSRTTDAAPDAYLNYFVFNSNYELISAKTGFQKISTAAEEKGEGANGHEKLSHSITIDEPGYVYIYLSNEEDAASPVDVFFDDFKVTQTHSPVVQKDDYLPFGLSFNSYSRAAVTAQNFKFNGGSEAEEMTDWYSTPFRKYDPSLGRFHGIDALASKYSSLTPSHFAANNPINLNDPTGLDLAPKSFDYLASDTDAVGSSLAGLDNGPRGNNEWARAGNIGRYGRGGSLYNRVYGSFTPGAGYYFAKHAIATFMKRAFSSYVGDISYKNFVTGEFFFSDGFNRLQAKQTGGVTGVGPVAIELPFVGPQNLAVGVGADHSYGGHGGTLSSLYSSSRRSMGGSGGVMPKMDPYFDGLTWDDIDGEYYDGGGGTDNVEDDSNRLALFLLAASLTNDRVGQLFDDVMRNLRYLAREGAMFDLDYSNAIGKASKWQKGIKVGGFVVAAAGVGVTYSDYQSGKIGLTEAVIDGTFGAVGAIPHPVAAGVSIIYFSGKGSLEAADMDFWNFRVGAYGRIYNQKTGKTLR